MGGWGSAHYTIVDVQNGLPKGGTSSLDFNSSIASGPKTSEQKKRVFSRENPFKLAAGFCYPIWQIFWP